LVPIAAQKLESDCLLPQNFQKISLNQTFICPII
jgi:hypothetical protein